MSRDPLMARIEIAVCVIAAVVLTYVIFGPTFFSFFWSLLS